MRILWLSHIVPYPPKGGVLQRSHNLLKQVSKKHEVHLVSLNQRKNLSSLEEVEKAIENLKTICNTLEIFPIPSDASKLHWSMMAIKNFFSSSPYDCNWLFNKEMFERICALSKVECYDLIHVDTIGMLNYAVPFSHVPVVLNHHNIESHMMQRRFEKETRFLKKVYFRNEAKKLQKLEFSTCPNCSMNLVVSDLDGIRLKEAAGEIRFTVVPNGVDVDYFQPRNRPGKHCRGLIFAGPMDWYPNRGAVLFFLSEIWPKLNEEMPDMPVTIIGRDPPKQLLKVARDSTISAPGYVDDVRQYIDSAKIYICPIRDGGGTRLKILDALAMEKPLVATGLAVEGLELVENEHYLRAETGLEFISQIKKLESDIKLCRKLAHAGRRFVEERYSWEVIGETIDRAYREAFDRIK